MYSLYPLLSLRLKAELEKKNVEYEEMIASTQHRHNTDNKLLRDQLAEAETSRQALEAEANTLRDKMAAMRTEVLTEQQEAVENLRGKYEREKSLLEEDNRKLASDMDSVSTHRVVTRDATFPTLAGIPTFWQEFIY